MSPADFPTRTYSEALGTISNAQLQAALGHFDLGTLVAAEPAQTGLFARNIFLTASKGEFVLRGAPWDPRQYGKEAFFSRLVHERTDVPAPWPYQIDLSTDIFGWAYAIMPRLPGIDVGNADVRKAFNRDDRIALARAMGEALAGLQDLTWPLYGDYDLDAGAIVPADTLFAEWTVARVRGQLDRCREASAATTDDDVAYVESIIDSARTALAIEPEQPTFVFRDFKENNTVAERTEGGWRVTGVFDLGEGYFADGEVDFSRTLADYLREDADLVRGFMQGYTAKRPLRPGSEQRFPLYMALDRMIIWAYGQRNNLWFKPETTLRDWLEPFTSFPIAEYMR